LGRRPVGAPGARVESGGIGVGEAECEGEAEGDSGAGCNRDEEGEGPTPGAPMCSLTASCDMTAKGSASRCSCLEQPVNGSRAVRIQTKRTVADCRPQSETAQAADTSKHPTLSLVCDFHSAVAVHKALLSVVF
jgi:hypothetical protein